MKRERLTTKREAMGRCLQECSVALSRYYQHHQVFANDMERMLAVLFILHTNKTAMTVRVEPKGGVA